VAGLVVTGGSGLLPDLDQYLEQLTNVPVRIGIPTGYSGLGDMINHPACSTAVGLVLHGSRCSNPGIAEQNENAGSKLKAVLSWLKEMFPSVPIYVRHLPPN